MPRTVAFLRAINVGGHVVRMETLREVAESLGLRGVETFLASGNLVFDGDAAAGLRERLEASLRATLGYDVAVFLRNGSEVAAIARCRPFPEADQAAAAAGAFCVGFLDAPLTPGAERTLMAFRTELDDFRASGREFYWLCRVKQSESAFTAGAFEKATGLLATLRGMNSLRRLAERLEGTPNQATAPTRKPRGQ